MRLPASAPRLQDTRQAAPLRIVFIGNALPRRCGIATFTTDLELALRHQDDVAETAIVAMCDPGGPCGYASPVRWGIAEEDAGAYLAAAEYINAGGYDVVSLQHEFGIFGGEAGSYLLGLIGALRIPLVTTLHTVLDAPSEAQRTVMMALLAASARVVVMARKARAILIATYGADPARIMVIPHGIPDLPLINAQEAKRRLGFADHRVILTFGLISPNKGIEVMIEAMPAVLEAARVGRARVPLVQPEKSEREGYVPNVVYSCGALKVGSRIVLPYAISDTFSTIATVKIDKLLDVLRF